MKHFNSIIGSAATRCILIRDQSGVSKTPDIHAIFHVIIITPEFTGIFTDTIYSNRFNDRLLWAVLSWRCRAEYSDRRWPVYFMQFFFSSDFQDIQQSLHI